jgi:hypothetical protein
MSQAKIEQAKKRVSSINWNYGAVVKEGSHILLFKEFLRRAALLVESFGTLDIPGSMWPILDFAAYIDSSLELDDDEIDSLAEELQVKGYPSWYSKRVCTYFLHWETIQDKSEVIELNLPNPYEPLIILYERGGIFRRDNDGSWEFHHAAFFVGEHNSYLNEAPVVKLDDDSLNQADNEFEASRELRIA